METILNYCFYHAIDVIISYYVASLSDLTFKSTRTAGEEDRDDRLYIADDMWIDMQNFNIENKQNFG